jgi:hypothetical protein
MSLRSNVNSGFYNVHNRNIGRKTKEIKLKVYGIRRKVQKNEVFSIKVGSYMEVKSQGFFSVSY